ncbi:MAG: photosynthetic complex putative assembly protein PuhB, partial [Rubrivivax sp.]
MTIQSNGHEHELEPQYGLPERLPAQEKILWQGSPDPKALARSAFHMRKLGLDFAALLALQAVNVAADGAALTDVLLALVWPAGLSALGLLGVWTLAWLTARTAVYTVTDRRVVMRIGIVLTLTFNLPLRTIESAGLRRGPNGHGDIVLTLKGPDHIAWLHLWPHARPWHLARTQPMLRALPRVV